jgi:urease accessory protein
MVLPSMAWAHPAPGVAHGFLHGFGHPFSGLDHLLAMVAVGLWAVQRGGRAVWALPLTFVATMLVGGALGVAGFGIPGVEAGILASVLVLGALVALAVRLPVAACGGIVALFALFHGAAHGMEMPAGAGVAGYAAGFASATALLHLAGALFATSVYRLLRDRPQVWVRVAGASISTAGLIFVVLGS